MSHGESRADRLREMERLYFQRAYSDIELAKRLGVDRTTIYRDRVALEKNLPIKKDENGRYHVDRTRYLSHIRVNLSEALSLYLAARRMSQQTRYAQKPIASGLEKLALSLRQPMTDRLVKAADRILAQEANPRRAQIFETVARAWIEGLMLRITYRALGKEQTTRHLFSPYLLEPSPWSDGIYLIGYSDLTRRVITLKLDRVERASLSGPFTVPEDFDDELLLQHAWGIWRGEGEPEQIVLHFHGKIAIRRLKESIWHPLETVEDKADGSCVWSAPIADWREMLPWIRGWGADVEVLEPMGLRERMRKTASRLGKQYQIMQETARLPYLIPYAKTKRDNPEEVHLLLYHLIDVGNVAQTMWQKIFTDGIRNRLAQILGLNVADCGRFLAFLAALHDLGKAGPTYQKKYAPAWLKEELNAVGLVLGDSRYSAKTREAPHGTVTTWALRTLLPEMMELAKPFANKIAVALGGHHGIWPQPENTKHIDDSIHEQWDQVRRDLVWELIAAFSPPKDVRQPASTTEMNAFLTILSGLTSVADWIGSRNDECFGYVGRPMATRRYAKQSAANALVGLDDLGWTGWQPTGEQSAFAETFAYLNFKAPRPVQSTVIDLAIDLAPPTMLILEAPTGIGKTEIALYIAEQWLQQQRGRGLYIAMPTMATSNQMYGRVGKFLHERYANMPINYHLVHGQAAWEDDLKAKIELQDVGEDEQAHISAESWFNPRKRTLLAPFGVGTVDQALMSILQTKHFFVRLFGLSHKVVIFDEVHAYDTYMNTLFHCLLTWLNAIGASVIILSATLPAKTRRELVEAYTSQALPDTETAYPALTIANAERQETISLPKPQSYFLALDWSVGREPAEIAEFLRTELAKGGCAAVICNTVGRAQAVYSLLEAKRRSGDLDIDGENLLLFHSRFPPVWRKEIEQQVLKKFGKGGTRPHKAIVVATQVIEQSLDIDFDLMISDLAPVDLILQRAGRLHRHSGNERYGLPRRLVIAGPKLDKDGLPQFVEDRFYGRYILTRSYFTLRSESKIVIPEDTSRLIESVYDNNMHLVLPEDIDRSRLQRMLGEMKATERKAQAKAGQALILKPDNRRLLKQEILGLEEDNPETHNTFRAQTRDIDFSITVVCLHRDTNELHIYGKNGEHLPIDLNSTPRPNMVKMLLQNALSIQHRGIGKYFVEQNPPQSWRKSAALRYCRYTIFENGICELPNYTLRLSRELGLEMIERETI